MLWLSALGGRDAFEGIGTSRAVATGRDQKGHKCSRRRSRRSGMPSYEMCRCTVQGETGREE
jgi:hypothetical protein